jgi:hypothetical protein
MTEIVDVNHDRLERQIAPLTIHHPFDVDLVESVMYHKDLYRAQCRQYVGVVFRVGTEPSCRSTNVIKGILS